MHITGFKDAVKTCFAPVADLHTRLLILGSLPGDRSLAETRYYAHPQNQFWPLIGAAIGRNLAAMGYEERLAALRGAGIGLWDVIATAERAGSGDAAIRAPAVNELADFAATLPALAAIGFNGATAWRIGTRALAGTLPGVERVALPSSSPLHTVGLAAKRPAWAVLADFLD